MQSSYEDIPIIQTFDFNDVIESGLIDSFEISEETTLDLYASSAFDSSLDDDADEGFFDELEDIDVPLAYFPESANEHTELANAGQNLDAESNIIVDTIGIGSGIFITLALLAVASHSIKK